MTTMKVKRRTMECGYFGHNSKCIQALSYSDKCKPAASIRPLFILISLNLMKWGKKLGTCLECALPRIRFCRKWKPTATPCIQRWCHAIRPFNGKSKSIWNYGNVNIFGMDLYYTLITIIIVLNDFIRKRQQQQQQQKNVCGKIMIIICDLCFSLVIFNNQPSVQSTMDGGVNTYVLIFHFERHGAHWTTCHTHTATRTILTQHWRSKSDRRIGRGKSFGFITIHYYCVIFQFENGKYRD